MRCARAPRSWPVQPRIVIGEQEKRAAFRIAHAALAKSGTVTLELALAGVPMVTAYRTGAIEAWILLQGDHGHFGDPGQPRGRRQRRAGIPASRLHAAKPVARAARRARRSRRCGGGRSRRLQRSTRSCRPATRRRARARPISCWRRCGRRGGRGRRISRRRIPPLRLHANADGGLRLRRGHPTLLICPSS